LVGWPLWPNWKWFQNHSYLDRKASGQAQVKQKVVAKVLVSEDDDTAVQEHLSELVKESSKKQVSDKDKVVQLLSLTQHGKRKWQNVQQCQEYPSQLTNMVYYNHHLM